MAAKTPDWKLDAYVDALARHGSHAQAAKVAGVGRSTAERHRKDNEEFRLLCEEAQEVYADALEREADRRAVKGVKEAVYYQGKVVGHKKNFSDVLLMFRLKGLRPEKYRERVDQSITGDVQVVVQRFTDAPIPEHQQPKPQPQPGDPGFEYDA